VRPDVSQEQLNKIRSTPGVAMCNGKIIHRWERSGQSHWILGSNKIFTVDGQRQSFKLTDIQVTDNLIYHICEPASGLGIIS
jgi:hypothetical protein